MIFIFFGPPGSGKGTQAQTLSQHFHLNYIATGNLLRAEVAAATNLGLKVKSYIDAGHFPPDTIIMDVFRSAFESKPDGDFLLDGIPRTLNQAKLLDVLFENMNLKITRVVDFDLSTEAVEDRILGRLSCSACGATYHKTFNPPKVSGVCDFCGEHALVSRSDDQKDVIKERLAIYSLETLPVLEYYKGQGIVTSIDASLPPEKVGEAIVKIIEESR